MLAYYLHLKLLSSLSVPVLLYGGDLVGLVKIGLVQFVVSGPGSVGSLLLARICSVLKKNVNL